jgi:hypothetical protein
LPFKLTVVEPKVPLVQSGSMNLKVKVERKPEFKGAVAVRMLWNPPGVGASNDVSIPADKDEALIPVNAAGNAAAGKWPIAVLGSSNVNGAAWVCSQPGTLEVAPPFVTAKVPMVAVEKGQMATVSVDLEQKTKFEGKAKVKLLGLPANTTAPELEITAADAKATFAVETTEKSPPGQHKSVFCQLIIEKDGEPIIHNIGQGGVLRIDQPSPKKQVAKAPEKPAERPAAAAAATPPPKPLSRLEKLRQEQASKKEGAQ